MIIHVDGNSTSARELFFGQIQYSETSNVSENCSVNSLRFFSGEIETDHDQSSETNAATLIIPKNQSDGFRHQHHEPLHKVHA